MLTMPIPATATSATTMRYSVSPCPLRFLPGPVPISPPPEVHVDGRKESHRRSGGGLGGGKRGMPCGKETGRFSNEEFDYRSNASVRIPYFFSFSNRVDLAIPSTRAVFDLFPFCWGSSPRIFVSSRWFPRERA